MVTIMILSIRRRVNDIHHYDYDDRFKHPYMYIPADFVSLLAVL